MARYARYTLLLGIVVLALLVSSSPADTLAGPVGGAGQVRYATSQRKGFDVCSAPTISQMQTWWNSSPYWDTVVYMGGSTRHCSQPNLNSSWVSSVHAQGWDFYLIWAGPQAPCEGGSINSNTFTAYNQGKQEADRADAAAWNLGFTGYNIYYYDMEYYDEANQACRDAVNSFLNGWGYQNRYLYGNMVGVYGSGYDAPYWASVPNVPDDVWIADWNWDPDVWGLAGLPDGLWYYGQRIHQYEGDLPPGNCTTVNCSPPA